MSLLNGCRPNEQCKGHGTDARASAYCQCDAPRLGVLQLGLLSRCHEHGDGPDKQQQRRSHELSLVLRWRPLADADLIAPRHS